MHPYTHLDLLAYDANLVISGLGLRETEGHESIFGERLNMARFVAELNLCSVPHIIASYGLFYATDSLSSIEDSCL